MVKPVSWHGSPAFNQHPLSHSVSDASTPFPHVSTLFATGNTNFQAFISTTSSTYETGEPRPDTRKGRKPKPKSTRKPRSYAGVKTSFLNSRLQFEQSSVSSKDARSVEERLSSALTAIKASGFTSFGHFLQALLDPTAQYREDTTVLHSLVSFLGGKGGAGKRPVDIVQYMYDHPRSKTSDSSSGAIHIKSCMPPYAIPETDDASSAGDYALHQPASALSVGARDSLRAWSLLTVLSMVDEESDALADEPLLRAPAKWGWGVIRSLSFTAMRERVMVLAPVIWSIVTTIAVGHSYRSKQAEAAQETLVDEDGDTMMEDDSEQGGGGTSSSKGSVRRDPWLSVATKMRIVPSRNSCMETDR